VPDDGVPADDAARPADLENDEDIFLTPPDAQQDADPTMADTELIDDWSDCEGAVLINDRGGVAPSPPASPLVFTRNFARTPQAPAGPSFWSGVRHVTNRLQRNGPPSPSNDAREHIPLQD
jgi:hypothetical protein